jgi:hypothetical protein
MLLLLNYMLGGNVVENHSQIGNKRFSAVFRQSLKEAQYPLNLRGNLCHCGLRNSRISLTPLFSSRSVGGLTFNERARTGAL